MKTIKFKKIKTGAKFPNLNIPIEMVVNWSGTLGELKEQANKVLESLEDDVFDYKKILKNHIKSQKWAEGHLLADGESIQLAMDVHKALNGAMQIEVDDKVADYICDVAASMAWTTGLAEETLPHAAEFKAYFKELKESKGEAVKEKK